MPGGKTEQTLQWLKRQWCVCSGEEGAFSLPPAVRFPGEYFMGYPEVC